VNLTFRVRPPRPHPPRAGVCALLLILLLSVDATAIETIPLDTLKRHLDAREIHYPLKDKIELRLDRNRRIIFTIFSPVVVVNQVAYRLPHPVVPTPGAINIPVAVVRVLATAVPEISGLASLSPPRTSPHRAIPPIVALEGSDPLEPLPTPDPDSLQALLAIDRIVIDAGHGGKDPGAIGHRGLKEKTITLAVARELERLIKRHEGLTAVMTRSRDRFISLGRRARLARETRGDVFVSLHCNASKRRGADGLEVYFLSEAKTEAAAAVAARENASIQFEDNADGYTIEEITGIRLSLLTSQFLKESQELAGSVRTSMTRAFDRMTDRGVKQANFHVMRGTMGSMPSVLVEMGFITNPKEAGRLKTSRHQKAMAQAIYEGILRFKRTHERQLESPGE